MQGRDYARLVTFLAIARERSFRGAAAQLGLAPSVVSRAVKELELELGTRLLDRTTRSVAPTEAGRALLDRLGPALREVDGALAAAREAAGSPGGTLRINLPRLGYQMAVAPRLSSFTRAYPDVALDLVIDDALQDIVATGFDAGIRVGGKVARDMIAVPLTPDVRPVVAGSPGYLAARGAPAMPAELRQHACLNYRWSETGVLFNWRFSGPEEADIPVAGPLVANDSDVLVDAALSGLGLVYLPEQRLHRHLADGGLVEVLAGLCAPVPGFFLYYAHRYLERPVLRAFIDHFRP